MKPRGGFEDLYANPWQKDETVVRAIGESYRKQRATFTTRLKESAHQHEHEADKMGEAKVKVKAKAKAKAKAKPAGKTKAKPKAKQAV